MLKGILYYKLENFTNLAIGPFFRRLGQSTFRSGMAY